MDDGRNTPLVRFFQYSCCNWVVLSVGGLIMKHCFHPAALWGMQRFLSLINMNLHFLKQNFNI